MCELFAMSSRQPADVCRSVTELARHGGLVGPHKDGWGVAYYHDDTVHLVKEAAPAATSETLRALQAHPFTSTTVVSHIRRATQGPVTLANCQPFVRELGGAGHVFAHNGDLVGLADQPDLPLGRWRPTGDTDSERAFCALLEQLRPLWDEAGRVPPLARRLAVLTAFAAHVRQLGPANFLYADGDAIFVHADRRHQGDGSGLRPPGLHLLCRRCVTEPGSAPADDEGQEVVLVASVPLSDEPWRPLAEGEVVALAHGRQLTHATPREPPR